ncbi:MAG: VOC family protein [Patescibacteria group bacterium]
MIKVSSILIGVSDLKKVKPFYQKLFGIIFDEFRPPFASFMFDGLEFNIEEDAPYRDRKWAKRNIGTRKNISFEVDSLDQFLKKAQKIGGKVIKSVEVKPWGWSEAVIADPDGNEFIIEQAPIANSGWIILERDGTPVKQEKLPKRPRDARVAEKGNLFTPWYKEDEHVHIENGSISGVHAKGTLKDVQQVLKRCLKYEKPLLKHFGKKEDIMLKDALKFISK